MLKKRLFGKKLPKEYSKYDKLPHGDAPDTITQGCLICEGGAFRGLYAQGVMDAMMREGINMQCTVGVSAGAMGGMNYVAGQIGRSIRINLKYRHDPRYISLLHRRQYGGIVNFDFVLKHVPDEPFNSERFYDPARRYVAVASNCQTGEAEYLDRDNCVDIVTAIQASASMPYVSKQVELGGQKYLDGGCSVKIPYQWAIDEGYEKIVVIRTRHEDFRYEDEKDSRMAYRVYKKHNPEFAEHLARTHKDYNQACEDILKLKDEGRLFVISPSRKSSVGRLERDLERLGKWYWLGYHDAKEAMPALKEYLGL